MYSLKKRLHNYISKEITSQLIYDNRVQLLNHYVLHSHETGISDIKHNGKELIVSLTTYNDRLYEVYLTIETVMQQTLKPNRIILWLGDTNMDIPLTLRAQERRGLEIKYCEDIRSYKKLIPALKEFPESIIITVDDDCLYHFSIIENLVKAYKKNPSNIYALRIHRMKLNSKGILNNYSQWDWDYQGFDSSFLNFPTGIGGILYPPHCFTDEVFNKNVFMDICPHADDIWFKAMSLMNGILSQKAFSDSKIENYIINEKVQNNFSLSKINNDKSMNDIQIKAVFKKYGLSRFLTEKIDDRSDFRQRNINP